MLSAIVDTGPIVALLDGRDAWHAWALDAFTRVRAPLVTCEAVITEACFLVRRLPGGGDAIGELIERGVLDLSFRADAEIADLRKLMRRYQDVPMSFADACLVRMSEQSGRLSVMTLDQDFRRYRRLGRQVIPLIAPR